MYIIHTRLFLGRVVPKFPEVSLAVMPVAHLLEGVHFYTAYRGRVPVLVTQNTRISLLDHELHVVLRYVSNSTLRCSEEAVRLAREYSKF